jgi:flagellar biosynthesis/type III secretory pathway ATPase
MGACLVKGISGGLVRAPAPQAFVGELFLIHSPRSSKFLKAEAVGFRPNEVLLLPLGELTGIGTDSEVVSTGNFLQVPVSKGVLGRVLNGLGEPLDVEYRGPLPGTESRPVQVDAAQPIWREHVVRPLSTGVRAIDGLIPCGEGQRLSLLAEPGAGKDSLLGIIARNAEVDLNVIVSWAHGRATCVISWSLT